MNEMPNELLVIIFDFLDFKSKLKSESVCKRWKHFIGLSFQNKTSLLIEDIDNSCHKRYGDYKPYNIENCGQLSVVCLSNFCHNIRSESETSLQRIVSKILNRFRRLNVLYICFTRCPLKKNVLKLINNSLHWNLQDLDQLSIICGHKKITITAKEVYNLCLKLPNLKVFQFEAYCLLIKEQTIQLIINKLQSLEVFIMMSLLSNSESKRYIEDYSGTAFKGLSPKIKAIKAPGFLLNERALNSMSEKAFNQLNTLRIFDLDSIKSMSIIVNSFTLISNLCCSLFSEIETESEANNFFKTISQLKKLQKLHLLIDSTEHVIGYNAIKYLKNCTQLTSLRLESTPLNVHCVEAISQFLPKLTKLELTYVRFNAESDACLYPIQELKALEYLNLSIDPELTDNTIIKIIKMGLNLNYIDVSRSELITRLTMEACLELANKKPYKDLNVVFDYQIKHQIEELRAIIPQNLIIHYIIFRKI